MPPKRNRSKTVEQETAQEEFDAWVVQAMARVEQGGSALEEFDARAATHSEREDYFFVQLRAVIS